MKPDDELIPTRASLLVRLKDWDDRSSWQEFFDTYWRLIYATAIKSGLSDSEAQEVVQETVIAVAKQMKGFKYDPAVGSFKGWLLKLTGWRIADQFRKRGGAAPLALVPADQTSGTDPIERIADPAGLDLEARWEADWQQNLMAAALQRVKQKVKAKHYQLFDLYANKGWTVDEIVNTLGVSADQVYKVKSRITAQIQKEVDYLQGKWGWA